eukprot:TRINITY_DN6754_c0_g1_i1.p1 TRINITY_DN6754_c0_g1~~TRINITY_DN6754_c0_g1_i1.p1  ORF type:complete len:623 (-),score=163.22 TRINITY_DN6754_c0_g1_i1:1308-3149(-)
MAQPAAKRQKLDNGEPLPVKEVSPIDTSSKPDIVGTRVYVTEADLGIETYLEPDRPSFISFFKERFSDFIVREVVDQDQIVHLTEMDVEPQWDIDFRINAEKKLTVDDDIKLNNLVEVVGQELADQIMEFANIGQTKEVLKLRGPFLEDKALRTNVHVTIKTYFETLETSTCEDEEGSYISVKWSNRRRGGQRQRRDWPADKPKYLRFVLHKINCETNYALGQVAKYAGVKPKAFSISGTKDKRAVTSQYVTIYKMYADRIIRANGRLNDNIKLGNLEYVDDQLNLGSHTGNHFTILLRNVQAEDALLNQACQQIADHGFINYFGTQRFGAGSIPNHLIGIKCINGEYLEAIDLILDPREGDSRKVTEARKFYYDTRDATKAWKKFPRNYHIESTLLKGIVKHGRNDALGSLNSIPRNMRLMYAHSVQSWFWNRMVTKHLELGGINPLVGDLVKNSEGEMTHITEETIGNYTLADVFIPLPGFSVKYPQNELFDFLKTIMGEVGLNPEDMKRDGPSEFSLPGGYREIVKVPVVFDWSIHQYDDPEATLLENDLDVLKGTNVDSFKENGEFKALKLRFILDSSTYATMLIRELTHKSTSALSRKKMREALNKTQ